MPDEHEKLSEEELQARVENLLNHANSLGLHGVIIVSPVCPGCGQLHDFSLFSDISEEGRVIQLLETFTKHCGDPKHPPVYLSTRKGQLQ